MKFKKALKIITSVVAFVVVLALLLGYVASVMTVPGDYRIYQWVEGFYQEPEDSLDAVYIGSSNCYAYWNSMTAWEEHGIAVWTYACPGMMFEAAEYIIKEGRKTQPDAVYVVNINAISNPKIESSKIHRTTDYMPMSLNKLALVNRLTKVNGYSFSESLEYYFPLIVYHDRWDELSQQDFNYELDGLKGASYYPGYLNKTKDVSKSYEKIEEAGTLPENHAYTINKLLDYCDKEKVKVLFVTVPRRETNADDVKLLNAANELIESRGYDTLNLHNAYDEIGIDLTQDYYNNPHTNIHGSLKFTNHVSEYLIEKYGFTDKRNNKAYSSWNEGWEAYTEKIDSSVLDFELENPNIDINLKRPASIKVREENKNAIVTWSPVDSATDYAVYRKKGDDGSWNFAKSVKDTTYTDTNCKSGQKYKYRIVPFYEKDNETYYGFFNYNGASITLQ